ncbi:8-amino-3,8-dideoxy-alpha-D-manno-octulosonate transaminase [Ectothiorhodosinus mongolicus]|uniref:8-amino-3,8-dideoxy-alpha-D-manno-octulosonate transaminase n=1 Tax=Ectothiorhodosinus mongolicus TaxID=233100 RepID=A0A1R3VN59_9GAMM|nr:DegT/DnrJ/EryC1/StrS family aminotransferase [Ectothiorhodosinus mongolicus]ULX56393.1 DegT/DnrJ/EryC1/StrS family aminotransferase [Ectothiorhodosinus mongolicus]SIT65914.1 8-amino-3,8-dideoxy-alpha-D-manno-octulosonate transaminase [Ectothiorhodosinus mongolicus]
MPGFEWFGSEERAEALEVLDHGVLMRYGFDGQRQGKWKALEFEKALADRMQLPYAHVCSSGTTAVFTAMACAGIGAGDEVIVPPFTFVADIEGALYAGAIPVYSEIDETLNLDPNKLEEKITERTKAVLLVHMCGSMAHVAQIRDICAKHNLILIEDVAQAIGASYQGQMLGSFGLCGCFSFDYVKTITCGEGGGIVSSDKDFYDRCQAFTDHGHDHLGADRGADKHPIMGFNFRIGELNAAIGLAQLRKLDDIIARNRRNKALIKDQLRDIPGLRLRDVPDPEGDSATFLSFILPDEPTALRARKELGEAGVDGCLHWYSNNWHYYRSWDHFAELKSPNPLYQTMSDDFRKPNLPQSDAIMAGTLSMLIKLSWDEGECIERGRKMREVLMSVLS